MESGELRVAIVGGRGFIGTNLAKVFKEPIIIDKNGNLEEIKKADVVINLAGATILKRWSESYKRELYNSRIETTKKIVSLLNDNQFLISASAIGIYENNCICDEDSKPADTFLANLAKEWEKEALKFKNSAVLRLGVVLEKNGGALKNMLLPFKLGLGGTIGRGCAYMSFIDMRDLISIYQFLIERRVRGVFNAVSPVHTTNCEFTFELARVLKRWAPFIIPPFVLKVLYGEGAEILLSSQRVYPKRLIEAGFKFQYETIQKSLERIFNVKAD